MSKNIYDMKRAPVNSTAARVLTGGEEYVPDKMIGNAADCDYLPVKPIAELHHLAAEEARRWQGHRFGRMTVVGYSADVPRRWVVRCACGVFTLRKLKAIKNPANVFDCCQHCHHLIFLKRQEHYRRTGKDKPFSYFYS